MIDPEEGDELLREIIRDKRRELNRDAEVAAREELSRHCGRSPSIPPDEAQRMTQGLIS